MRDQDEINDDIAKVAVDETVAVREDIDMQIRLFVYTNHAATLESILSAA